MFADPYRSKELLDLGFVSKKSNMINNKFM